LLSIIRFRERCYCILSSHSTRFSLLGTNSVASMLIKVNNFLDSSFLVFLFVLS
jgi:hypothetical protein